MVCVFFIETRVINSFLKVYKFLCGFCIFEIATPKDKDANSGEETKKTLRAQAGMARRGLHCPHTDQSPLPVVLFHGVPPSAQGGFLPSLLLAVSM